MPTPRFHGVFSSLLGEKVGVIPEEQSTAQGSSQSDDASADPVPLRTGQIAVDVYEDGGYLVIKAPIAGVRLSDLDIDIAENTITIRGERKQTDELEGDQYLVQECYWGAFSRRIDLPHAVNPSKVKATFSKDNILKIFVPKDDGRKVRIVKINEGG